MIVFQPTWNTELRARYAAVNQVFNNQFDENAVIKMIYDAKPHFNDRWCKEFISIASDPFERRSITIVKATHQPEDTAGGGYKVHFNGKDTYGFEFHFYVKQNFNSVTKQGSNYISEISYIENRVPRVFKRRV